MGLETRHIVWLVVAVLALIAISTISITGSKQPEAQPVAHSQRK